MQTQYQQNKLYKIDAIDWKDRLIEEQPVIYLGDSRELQPERNAGLFNTDFPHLVLLKSGAFTRLPVDTKLIPVAAN